MLVHTYEENTVGNDYVVGDIHGCFTRLQKMLDKIGFNPEVDRLFSVGDLVDRGPESHLALEWLEKPWFIALMGNHEEMAIDYHIEGGTSAAVSDKYEEDYRSNGGEWNIKGSYGQTVRAAEAFSKLPIAIEYQRVGRQSLGLIHADCPFGGWERMKEVFVDPADPWFQLGFQNAMWDRRRVQGGRHDTIRGVEYLLVGHTPMPRPTMINNVVYLDTGAVFLGDGYFTILRLKDMVCISETGAFPFSTDGGYIEDIVGDIPVDELIGDDVIAIDGSWYACYYGQSHQFIRTVKVVSDTGGTDLMVYDTKGYRVDLMSKFGIDFYELTTPSRQNFA